MKHLSGSSSSGSFWPSRKRGQRCSRHCHHNRSTGCRSKWTSSSVQPSWLLAIARRPAARQSRRSRLVAFLIVCSRASARCSCARWSQHHRFHSRRLTAKRLKPPSLISRKESLGPCLAGDLGKRRAAASSAASGSEEPASTRASLRMCLCIRACMRVLHTARRGRRGLSVTRAVVRVAIG